MDAPKKPDLTIKPSKPVYTEYAVPSMFGFGSRRERSGSFSQTFQAFDGDRQVGSARIEHHTNNPKYVAFSDPPRPDELAERTPHLPTTYLARIDNFTVGNFEPTKGVGSGLMQQVEQTAREVGAQKLTLLPAPGKIKKAQFPAEQMASKDIPESEKYKSVEYDPTGFYQHLGFSKDSQERTAVAKQIQGLIPDDELAVATEKRTSHMSKML